MVRFVHVKDFDGVDGGVSLPFHAIKEFTALNKLVFSHYERNADAFDLHFDTSDKPDACEFPVSKALWDSGEYMPRSDSDTLIIFAHFMRKSHARRAPDIRELHQQEHASRVPDSQHVGQRSRTTSAKTNVGQRNMRRSRSSQDRSRLDAREVAQNTVYSYKDLHPSIETAKIVESGRIGILVGYLERAGSDKTLVYASIDPQIRRINRRTARMDVTGQSVAPERRTAVSHADTVYLKEFQDVADDSDALYDAVYRAAKAGMHDTVRPIRDRSASPSLSDIGSGDGPHFRNRSEKRLVQDKGSRSSIQIRTRFVFQKGSTGFSNGWADFEVDLPADMDYEEILSVVERRVHANTSQSHGTHTIRQISHLQISLGADEHSLQRIGRQRPLSSYTSPASDRSTKLHGHVCIFLRRTGTFARNVVDSDDLEVAPDWHKGPIPTHLNHDKQLEQDSRANASAHASAFTREVLDLSFEDVHLNFLVTGRSEAAVQFRSWSDLRITLDADATYPEVKESLRPLIMYRLRRSKIGNACQSLDHISFEFTLNTDKAELIPLTHGQTLREFVLQAGTGPRLTGEVTIDAKQNPPPADAQDAVHIADTAPSRRVNRKLKLKLSQRDLDYSRPALDSASVSHTSSSPSCSSLTSPPPSPGQERDDTAQDDHRHNGPIEVLFNFEDRFHNGGNPFIFKEVKWDLCGDAQERFVREQLTLELKSKLMKSRRPNVDKLMRTITFDVNIDNGRTWAPLSPKRVLSDYLATGDGLRKLIGRVVLRRKEDDKL